MATKPKTSEKSFWRKRKAEEDFLPIREETEEIPAEQQAEATTAAVDDTVADVSAELTTELKMPQGFDLSADAEDGSRDLADLALTAARKAELAHMIEQAHITAQKQAELDLLEEQAAARFAASEESRSKAADLLRELGEYEDAYAAAREENTVSVGQLDAVRRERDEKLRGISENHVAQTAALQARIERLEQSLAENRSEVEQVRKEEQVAAKRLEEANKRLQQITAEGGEAIRQAAVALEDRRSAVTATRQRIAQTEEQIAHYQFDSEQLENERRSAAVSFAAAGEEIEQMRSGFVVLKQNGEEKQLRRSEEARQQQEKMQQRQAELQAVVDNIGSRLVALEQEYIEREAEVTEADRQVGELRKELDELEQSIVRRQERVAADLEDAKNEVMTRKESYSAAQDRVQNATSRQIKSNVRVKCAAEQCERAARELEDATIAFDMAKKMRDDAVAAKGSDEASSMLLSKAESVLMATIASANQLLNEKQRQDSDAKQEMLNANEEAEQARLEVENSGVAAEEMITRWLSAEEALARLTAQIETERVQMENERTSRQPALEVRLDAAEGNLSQLRQQQDERCAALEQLRSEFQTANDELAEHSEQQELLKQHDLEDAEYLKAEAAREQEEYSARLKEREEDFARATNDYHRFQQEAEERMVSLQEGRSGDEKQLGNLQKQVEELESIAAESELELAAVEKKYRELQNSIRQEIESSEHLLHSSGSSAVEASAAQLEERLRFLTQERAGHDADNEELMAKTRSYYEQQLQEMEKSASGLQKKISDLEIQVKEKRRQMQAAVDEAQLVFDDSSKAHRLVENKRIDNDIFRMREEARVLNVEIEEKKAAFSVFDVRHDQLQKRLADLDNEVQSVKERSEKERTMICDEKQQLNDRYVEELDELEQQRSVKQGEIDEAERMHAEAVLRCEEAEHENEMALLEIEDGSEMRQTLRALSEIETRYAADRAVMDDRLPKLLAATNNAEAAILEARVAAEDAAAACAEQKAVIAEARAAEMSQGDRADEIDRLRSAHEERLNQINVELLEIKAQHETLLDDYRQACSELDSCGTLDAELQAKLEQLQDSDKEERERCEAEIAELNQKLQTLRTDADEKELRFREAEKTLMNRNELIETAETACRVARENAVAAEAEWHAAQAARETANSLAQQANESFSNLDKETAAIMRRTSDELFNAVESATALVAAKEKSYQDAVAAVKKEEASVESLRHAVGEAPVLLSESRDMWRSAYEVYSEFKSRVDRELPAVRKRQNKAQQNFRTAIDAVSAEIKENNEKTVRTRAAADELSGRISELEQRITDTAEQLEQGRIAADQAVSDAERISEQEQRELRARREAAEQRGVELGQLREQAGHHLEQCITRASAAEAEYNTCQREYANLNNQFESSRSELLTVRDRINSNAEQSQQKLDEARTAEEQNRNDLIRLRRELSDIQTACRSKASLRESAIEEKDEQLSVVDNKLNRRLCDFTLKRMELQVELDSINEQRAEKYAVYNEAARRGEELDACLARAEAQLAANTR